MSGGQRQAVAIARTRLSNAKLVMMDEPTAAISVRQVEQVLGLIHRLKEQGVAVMLISHRMPDVFAVCDRVIVHAARREAGRQADPRYQSRGSDGAHHRRERGGVMAVPVESPISFSNVGRVRWWRRGIFASQTAYVTASHCWCCWS